MQIIRIFSLTLLIVQLFFINRIAASEYAVSNIDPQLMVNAVAVVRDYHTELDIFGKTSSVLRQKIAITVLEPRGLHMADVHIDFDSFRSLRQIKGTLYDESGNLLRELNPSEFTSRSLANSFSLYSDIWYISSDLRTNQFPFTVVYEYVYDYKLAYLNKAWSPLSNVEMSIEKSSLTITHPPDMSFRHRVSNPLILGPEQAKTDTNKDQFRWEFNHFPAIKMELFMPRWIMLAPFVIVSPDDFYYGGYHGNMSTWENFGHWINSLNRNRQKLPRKLRREIVSLTSHTTDTLEKIRIVNEYVQKTTRYVSINLGIGGFQPASASSVYKSGYGDCKALTNYTQSLLEAIDIQSWYTLVLSGSDHIPAEEEFPHNYFNHVILCVPLHKDTLWIETTVPWFPTGFLGSSNSARKVLIVTDKGGVISTTPDFVQEESQTNQHVLAALQDDGIVNLSLRKRFTGWTFEERAGIHLVRASDQKENFIQNNRINQMSLKDLSYTVSYEASPLIEKNAEMEIEDYLRRAGNRYVLRPVILQQEFPVLPPTEERVNPLELGSTGVFNDTIHWSLPERYRMQSLPQNVNIETPYGKYSLHFSYCDQEHKLTVCRRLLIISGFYEPDHYNEFARFLNQIRQADRSGLFLIPETGVSNLYPLPVSSPAVETAGNR